LIPLPVLEYESQTDTLTLLGPSCMSISRPLNTSTASATDFSIKFVGSYSWLRVGKISAASSSASAAGSDDDDDSSSATGKSLLSFAPHNLAEETLQVRNASLF
jgi:hypothetical protein